MGEESKTRDEAGIDPAAQREALERHAAELADLESQIAALTAPEERRAEARQMTVEDRVGLLGQFKRDLLQLAMSEPYGEAGGSCSSAWSTCSKGSPGGPSASIPQPCRR